MTQRTGVPVTSGEVALAVSGALGSGAAHRDTLAAVARGTGARREVLGLIYRAPAFRYQHLQQLLDALPISRSARD